MQGPKVAVVVVSVFNTLNTIDCRVRARRGGRGWGLFIYFFFFISNDARIRLDNKRFAVGPGQARPGEEVRRHLTLSAVPRGALAFHVSAARRFCN